MTIDLEVQVLSESDRSDRSEPPGADREGSELFSVLDGISDNTGAQPIWLANNEFSPWRQCHTR